MKFILFVSPGRCGTRRLYEILNKNMATEHYVVKHQMDHSRLANIIGNVLYYFGNSEHIKSYIFNKISLKHLSKETFICTDPLTSMIIPEKVIKDNETVIIQISRNGEDFARSFFKRTRDKWKSFVAHNFIPFWQIGILPFENLINKNIKNKYIKVSELKHNWFNKNYSMNPNYEVISMEEMFNDNKIELLLNKHIRHKITIPSEELKIKSN